MDRNASRFADLTLLKASETRYPDTPAAARLEAFKNL